MKRQPGPRVGRISFLGWDEWERFCQLWAIIGRREEIYHCTVLGLPVRREQLETGLETTVETASERGSNESRN